MFLLIIQFCSDYCYIKVLVFFQLTLEAPMYTPPIDPGVEDELCSTMPYVPSVSYCNKGVLPPYPLSTIDRVEPQTPKVRIKRESKHFSGKG